MSIIGSLRNRVVVESYTWLNTPYHHEGTVKGVGVDCAMFPLMVYRNSVGMLMNFDPRPYSPEWHLHRSEEKYLKGLHDAGAREVSAPQVGDLAVFQFGRTVSHGAIILETGDDILFAHSYLRIGVILTRMSEFDYADRLHSYWSILP